MRILWWPAGVLLSTNPGEARQVCMKCRTKNSHGIAEAYRWYEQIFCLFRTEILPGNPNDAKVTWLESYCIFTDPLSVKSAATWPVAAVNSVQHDKCQIFQTAYWSRDTPPSLSELVAPYPSSERKQLARRRQCRHSTNLVVEPILCIEFWNWTWVGKARVKRISTNVPLLSSQYPRLRPPGAALPGVSFIFAKHYWCNHLDSWKIRGKCSIHHPCLTYNWVS